MLIRSMDKTILGNAETADCIFIKECEDEYIVTVRTGNNDIEMAKFKTEEEDKEALKKLFIAYGCIPIFDFENLRIYR